jgi:hypothetical protein
MSITLSECLFDDILQAIHDDLAHLDRPTRMGVLKNELGDFDNLLTPETAILDFPHNGSDLIHFDSVDLEMRMGTWNALFSKNFQDPSRYRDVRKFATCPFSPNLKVTFLL